MLHNIMKQYRTDFKKIPILRKVLKVHMLAALLYRHITPGTFSPTFVKFHILILSCFIYRNRLIIMLFFFPEIDTPSPS